jgi:ATP-dependent protease ClpP protease subunit
MKIVNITGEIGWDLLPKDVKKQLDEAAGDDLELNIASPGGYVFDGIEIYNMIRAYKRTYPNAQILGNLSGIVASMASYIAMNPAIDLLAAEDNAVFMIHNVWGIGIGNKNDLRKTADIFDGLDNILNDAYIKKTGKSKKEIADLMDAESWYYGAEIKDAGFADEIIDAPKEDEQNKAVLVLNAKAKFKALSEKLKSRPEDCEKIAASLKPLNTPGQPVAQNTLPAQGEPNQEVTTMTYADFLSSNPAAKTEHDAALQAKFDAGKSTLQAVITGASKYLRPDCQYPATIKAIAIDVLDGKLSLEALETTVRAFDALKESGNSAAAQTETSEVGTTPGQQTVALSPDGQNKTEADYQAMLARDKAAAGIGGK